MLGTEFFHETKFEFIFRCENCKGKGKKLIAIQKDIGEAGALNGYRNLEYATKYEKCNICKGAGELRKQKERTNADNKL